MLQCAGGSLFDAVSMAILVCLHVSVWASGHTAAFQALAHNDKFNLPQAALRTTQIPNWVVTKDEDGDAVDFELSDDPYDVGCGVRRPANTAKCNYELEGTLSTSLLSTRFLTKNLVL